MSIPKRKIYKPKGSGLFGGLFGKKKTKFRNKATKKNPSGKICKQRGGCKKASRQRQRFIGG